MLWLCILCGRHQVFNELRMSFLRLRLYTLFPYQNRRQISLDKLVFPQQFYLNFTIDFYQCI